MPKQGSSRQTSERPVLPITVLEGDIDYDQVVRLARKSIRSRTAGETPNLGSVTLSGELRSFAKFMGDKGRLKNQHRLLDVEGATFAIKHVLGATVKVGEEVKLATDSVYLFDEGADDVRHINFPERSRLNKTREVAATVWTLGTLHMPDDIAGTDLERYTIGDSYPLATLSLRTWRQTGHFALHGFYNTTVATAREYAGYRRLQKAQEAAFKDASN